MEPTIYKPGAYKTPGVYKGAGSCYNGKGIYKIDKLKKWEIIYKNDFTGVDSAEIFGGPASYRNLVLDSFGLLFSGYDSRFSQSFKSYSNKTKFKISFEKSTTNGSTTNAGQFCGFWRLVSFNYVRYYYDSNPKTILQIFNVDSLTYYGNYTMSSHDGSPYYTYYLLQNTSPTINNWEKWECFIDYDEMRGEIKLNNNLVCSYTLKDALNIPSSGSWLDGKYEGINGIPHYVRNLIVEAY